MALLVPWSGSKSIQFGWSSALGTSCHWCTGANSPISAVWVPSYAGRSDSGVMPLSAPSTRCKASTISSFVVILSRSLTSTLSSWALLLTLAFYPSDVCIALCRSVAFPQLSFVRTISRLPAVVLRIFCTEVQASFSAWSFLLWLKISAMMRAFGKAIRPRCLRGCWGGFCWLRLRGLFFYLLAACHTSDAPSPPPFGSLDGRCSLSGFFFFAFCSADCGMCRFLLLLALARCLPVHPGARYAASSFPYSPPSGGYPYKNLIWLSGNHSACAAIRPDDASAPAAAAFSCHRLSHLGPSRLPVVPLGDP